MPITWYVRQVNHRPMPTGIVTAGLFFFGLSTATTIEGLIAGGGDLFAQLGIERAHRWDAWRTGRFAILAAFLISPSVGAWFRLLERVKGHPKTLPLKRLVIDQIVFAPGFNALVLFSLRSLEGRRPSKAIEDVRRDWWPIYSTRLQFWPLVQMTNFYVVPLEWRGIVRQVANFFWTAYLSYTTQNVVGRFDDDDDDDEKSVKKTVKEGNET